MYRSWRHEADGLVVVERDDGATFVPVLSGAMAASFDAVDERWGERCGEVESRFGIPRHWLTSMVWRESNGNPRARNPEVKPGPEDDGVGLLQITSRALKVGYTDAQLEEPGTNLEIGARYVVSLIKRYGRDFPRVSAAFNAGSARPGPNDWNLYCTRGHVEAEVCALNRAILRRQAEAAQLRGEVAALQFDLVPLARADADEARAERATRPEIGGES